MACPCEVEVRSALAIRGLEFTEEEGPANNGLDFYVESLGLHIEVKQFHSPRISEQMARAQNVIGIQGIGAAKAFAWLLNGGRPDDLPLPAHPQEIPPHE